MAILAVDISTSKQVTVSATSAAFGTTMLASQKWLFISSTNCWIKQGAAGPTAVAGTNGNMFVPAGYPQPIDGACGVDLAVVQDTTGGKASLTLIRNS